MATTAGALTLVSKSSTQIVASSAVATGGTGPYTYQWYIGATSGFTPGPSNIITGATSLSVTVNSLIPNSSYFLKVVATDSGAVSGTSSALAVVTDVPSQSQNQFVETPFLGMIDMRFDYNTISAQIDVSQATALIAGSAVKIVDSAGGVPKVVSCSASSDEVFGFINYDIKSKAFVAGDKVELSQAGNVMFLYASSAIARGAQVQLDASKSGAVTALVGSSGADIVGFAFDKAVASGDLIRVRLGVPSFQKA